MTRGRCPAASPGHRAANASSACRHASRVGSSSSDADRSQRSHTAGVDAAIFLAKSNPPPDLANAPRSHTHSASSPLPSSFTTSVTVLDAMASVKDAARVARHCAARFLDLPSPRRYDSKASLVAA